MKFFDDVNNTVEEIPFFGGIGGRRFDRVEITIDDLCKMRDAPAEMIKDIFMDAIWTRFRAPRR